MNPDRVSVIQASCLQRWGTTPPQLIPPCTPAQSPRYQQCPFPINDVLNNIICLWEGDITVLEADGVIAGTNEYEPPRLSIKERVFHRSRRRQLPDLKVGEVRVVNEPSIVAEHLIYTLGPKYKPRCRTTSDQALHTAYKNTLDKARQLGLSTVGLGVIHSSRKHYPSNYGAHIALRTLRRYLENYPDDFKILVLVVDPYNHGLYERILPLYFPRSAREEEASRWKLPSPLGGIWGEPIPQLPGEMRIIENPQDDEDADPVYAAHAKLIGFNPFGTIKSDTDPERLIGGRNLGFTTGDDILDLIMKDFEERGRYERMLRRARHEDLSDIAKLGCLYQNGTDRLGRPVIIFVGKWFRVQETNLYKFFLYMISFLDYLVNHDYVMVYFHTKTTQENRPGLKWFTSIYNILPYKYKKNLKALYIVHPSFWTKSLTWWFGKFVAPSIRRKIHNMSGVEYLYSIIVPSQLEIPAFITEYDISINGVCYYKPSEPLPEEDDDDFETMPPTSVLRASISGPEPSSSFGYGFSDWEPFDMSSTFGPSLWEIRPTASGHRHTRVEPQPSTSRVGSSFDDPRPSTSGLSSSSIEPVPSTSGLGASARGRPETSSDDGTSTWELRPSPSGYRFSKLGPRPSKSQKKPDPWTPQPVPSTSQAGSTIPKSESKTSEPEKPQPKVVESKIIDLSGPSESRPKPDPWTPQPVVPKALDRRVLEPLILDPQPGPSAFKPRFDPWTPQPSTSRAGLPTSRSEPVGWQPQLSRSTSQPKPGPSPWQPQPGPSGLQSQKSPSAWEPQPGPSGLQSPKSPSAWEPQPGPSGLQSPKSPSAWEPQPGPSGLQSPKSPSAWEPQPGPSGMQRQRTPSESKPKPDPWTPQPSTSRVSLPSSRSEPIGWEFQPGPSTSQQKSDPWKLQPSSSASQLKSKAPEPQPASSQPQPRPGSSQPQPRPGPSQPQTGKSSSKSTDPKKKSSKKKSGMASTFV